MKVKEQNVWLSAVGFVQMIFMASAAAALSEYTKTDRDAELLFFSALISVILLMSVVRTYIKMLKRSKK